MPRKVAGADVWDSKWVVVTLVDGQFKSVDVVDALRDFLAQTKRLVCLGVDMPIELSTHPGPRACDIEARAMVGKRSSSVFSAMPLALLSFEDPDEANAEAQRIGATRLSRQSHALRDKILEVRALRDEFPVLHEVHPEVSFVAANKKQEPLEWSKHTWNGFEERRAILKRQGLAWRGPEPGASSAGVDDVLDATIAAWSADRIARGVSKRLPRDADAEGVIEY